MDSIIDYITFNRLLYATKWSKPKSFSFWKKYTLITPEKLKILEDTATIAYKQRKIIYENFKNKKPKTDDLMDPRYTFLPTIGCITSFFFEANTGLKIFGGIFILAMVPFFPPYINHKRNASEFILMDINRQNFIKQNSIN